MAILTKNLRVSSFALVLALSLNGNDSNIDKQSARVPILLELFTSEGCSSCPPADKLVESLDREQPVAGVELVVISEHVDYWNQLGWIDPYSSRIFSERQQEYASRLGSDVYTPQLVVDGDQEAVGGNWSKIKRAIETARSSSKMSLLVTARRQGTEAIIHIEVPSVPDSGRGQIFVVLASDHVQTNVTRGENGGHELSHTAVAYSFQKIGTLPKIGAFQKDVRVPLKEGSKPPDTRAIIFIQKAGAGRIMGIAETRY